LEADRVRRHQEVREQVQSQVRIGRGRYGCAQFDLDLDDLELNTATLVRSRLALERCAHRRRVAVRETAEGRGGEPGVENGAVGGARGEADAGGPERVSHTSRLAALDDPIGWGHARSHGLLR